MPAVRVSRRRRSSLAMSFTPAKAGTYGISSRPVTFAPNITPVSYVEPDSSDSTTPEPSSPTSTLFPACEEPAPAPSRRRQPPGKRRSLGYIPRPPNAFMLFRADFVRQKHVPGSIETNHGSLSKIIGNCWRSLPLDEKRVWEVKAKHAKAEHKKMYPDYRFRPVHNKNKEKKKEKVAATIEDERRCEEVAQFLLEGKKGDELAAAVRSLDMTRDNTPAPPVYSQYPTRRSSSVPLPNDYFQHFSNIALPSVPFLSSSRPSSPVSSIARQQRYMYGSRRSSSARPANYHRSWTMPVPSSLQRDHSALPEPDTSLFESSYLDATSSNFFPMNDTHSNTPFNINDLMTNLPPHVQMPLQHAGPLDPIAPHQVMHPQNMYQSTPEFDSSSWIPLDAALQSQEHSHPSTAYSGSPATSDGSLPVVHAPQPQLAAPPSNQSVFADMWKEFGSGSFSEVHQHYTSVGSMDTGLGLDFNSQGHIGVCGGGDSAALQSYTAGLDSLFEPHQTFDPGFAYHHEYNDMLIEE